MTNHSTASRDVAILAATLYGEAEAHNRIDAEAVAAVIMNRAARPCWWSLPHHDPISVCLRPRQFSCWDWLTVGAHPSRENDRARLAPLFDGDPALGRLSREAPGWFGECLEIAKSALERGGDPAGANHYVRSDARRGAAWARGREPLFVVAFARLAGGAVAGHLYYHIAPDAPALPADESASTLNRIAAMILESKRRKGALVAGGAGAVLTAAGVDPDLAQPILETVAGATAQGDPARMIMWCALGLLALHVGWTIWTRMIDEKAAP